MQFPRIALIFADIRVNPLNLPGGPCGREQKIISKEYA